MNEFNEKKIEFKKSISFPYTFTHNNISKKLSLKDKKKKTNCFRNISAKKFIFQ